jgi:hypothetical protein
MREDICRHKITFTSYTAYDFITELYDYIMNINHLATPELHCLLGYK